MELLVDELQRHSATYQGTRQEVPYLSGSGSCDLVLPGEIPVGCKLIRYWRANGDSEDYMPKQVFSSFHENMLLTDAQSLSTSTISRSYCSTSSASARTSHRSLTRP